MTLSIHEVYKTFGTTQALAGVSFEVCQGQVAAVLGPSGCGKSTLLAVIAGLEPPDGGDILWAGESLADTSTHKRGFGLMFQDYALFPHLDAAANVAFGLRMAGLPAEETEARVSGTLALVGLPGFEARDVNTLSGGEQQRVALARSLAPRPRLLMLDEPLGSLDRSLRERLLHDLQLILRSINQTTIYVTHDQGEAFALADQVVVMQAGSIAQAGAPQAIYRRPASPFVASFLGLDNLLAGQADTQDGQAIARTPIGDLPLPQTISGPVTVLLRPDAVTLTDQSSCYIEGNLAEVSFRGETFDIGVDVKGTILRFTFPATANLPPQGERIRLGYECREAVQVWEDV